MEVTVTGLEPSTRYGFRQVGLVWRLQSCIWCKQKASPDSCGLLLLPLLLMGAGCLTPAAAGVASTSRDSCKCHGPLFC